MNILTICCFSFGEISSPFDLIASLGTNLSSPATLTAKQVQDDLNFLMNVFNETFAGKFYFSNDELSKFTQSLNTISGEMKTSDFWIALDSIWLKIPDSHTGATFFKNGYNQMTPIRRAQFRAPQVGKNRISDSSKVWEVTLVGNKKDVALIAIAKFPSAQDPTWKTFLDSIRDVLKSSNAVIIDLRSNSGGDDYFGMEMAKIFWGGPFHHLIEKQINNTSASALAIMANHFRLQSIYSGQDTDPNSIPEQVVKSLTLQVGQALNGLIPNVQIRSKVGSDSSASVTESGYKKPIYVLADSLTSSSGEFTALAFALHPFAKIFGENSAGFIHFGNAGKVLLPNSKIQVSISTQFNQLENHLFFEKIGITPNQIIPPGTDAYDSAMIDIHLLKE